MQSIQSVSNGFIIPIEREINFNLYYPIDKLDNGHKNANFKFELIGKL